MPQEIRKISYQEYEDEGKTLYHTDVTPGELYRLDNGDVIVAIKMSHLTPDLALGTGFGRRSKIWSLPSYPPKSIGTMNNSYREDYTDEEDEIRSPYTDEIHLFSPGGRSIDPDQHDPTVYGGKAPEKVAVLTAPVPDPRIIKELDGGVVVIRLKDVPAGVKRSSGNTSIDETIRRGNSGDKIGEYVGPKTDDQYANENYYVRVLKADLLPHTLAPPSTSSVQSDPRIVQELADGIIVVRLKDVPAGVARGAGDSRLQSVVEQLGNPNQYIGPESDDAGSDRYYARIKKKDLPALTTAVISTSESPRYRHGNSGRTYNFETGKNPIDGTLGWKPIDLNGEGKGLSFDPVAPVMAIHDLMEHFPGEEYDPHNEYQAQGAMLWLRLEGGFFGTIQASNTRTFTDSVVRPAFGMLFYHIDKGKLETKEIDQALLKDTAKMPEKTFFALNALLHEANVYIPNNFSSRVSQERLHQSLFRGIPWIHLGYHRAGERYAGLDKKKLVNLYRSTVDQISSVKTGSKMSLTMKYELYEANVGLSAKVTV